ncbi:MAG: tRNA glutamyl-Q(34) synthetase GluQRS [Pseudomonadota bacterium]
MTDDPVFRFAPSPNGRLHLGHALSALTTFELARRVGGRVLLRIEDIDLGRSRDAYVTGILEDLEWLGLTWEEPVLRQSTRFDAYLEAAARLEQQGLLYRCAATRAEIRAAAGADPVRDPDGAPLYTRACGYARQDPGDPPCVEHGTPTALRLDMAAAIARLKHLQGNALPTYTAWDGGEHVRGIEARPDRWGDAILIRKDIPASYHLAVVVDDAFQAVTHVTRGRDLEPATDLQLLLQALLGLPQPIYHHHRLIADTDGRKLSKSARDTALSDLRATGTTPADIRRAVGLT